MELKSLVEAILFAAQKPLSLREIRNLLARPESSEDSEWLRAFRKTREAEISAAIQELKVDYTQQGRSFQIQEAADAFQLVSQPQFAPWLKPLFEEHHTHRLSQPALETLAIIAYRQPITRADIESVRGVAVDGVMQTLLERGLVTITGRADVPGRPMLYGTTRLFLQHFGLKDLNELPAVEELRKVNLRLPESDPPPASTADPQETGKTENAKSASTSQTS
ncbi:MAG: SMC-Scp complex subunit ScpB [Verrucomicrobia bacterium]|nr:SMC-Scp complex subunit ScpB [Verrucomicrobiota bacterium]